MTPVANKDPTTRSFDIVLAMWANVKNDTIDVALSQDSATQHWSPHESRRGAKHADYNVAQRIHGLNELAPPHRQHYAATPGQTLCDEPAEYPEQVCQTTFVQGTGHPCEMGCSYTGEEHGQALPRQPHVSPKQH